MNTIQELELSFNQATEECNRLAKELQACKDEYDAYERKDIQYHENMKAQKSSHKKLRSKRDSNQKEIEEKTRMNAQMENSLKEYDEEIEKAKETKEEIEQQLNAVLAKFKEEINRLKEKRAEIEVWIAMRIEGRPLYNLFKRNTHFKCPLLMKRRRSLTC